MTLTIPPLALVVRTLLASLACFVAYTAYIAWLIRDGAAPLAFLYEQDVQDVAVASGLVTREQLAANLKRFLVVSYLCLLVGLAIVTLVVNGTRDLVGLWWQTTLYIWLWNAYDHFVIDTLWVGHTNAWQIPGTEGWDYIPKGAKSRKRIAIALVAPVVALALAAVVSAILG